MGPWSTATNPCEFGRAHCQPQYRPRHLFPQMLSHRWQGAALGPAEGLFDSAFPRPSFQLEQQTVLHQTAWAQTKPEGNVSGPLCTQPLSFFSSAHCSPGKGNPHPPREGVYLILRVICFCRSSPSKTALPQSFLQTFSSQYNPCLLSWACFVLDIGSCQSVFGMPGDYRSMSANSQATKALQRGSIIHGTGKSSHMREFSGSRV